uniref:Uncharacterized protein n=1 Tax=Trichogramma kaykai TaxID=54128 RepID=A0ABD2WVS1_9HYME
MRLRSKYFLFTKKARSKGVHCQRTYFWMRHCCSSPLAVVVEGVVTEYKIPESISRRQYHGQARIGFVHGDDDGRRGGYYCYFRDVVVDGDVDASSIDVGQPLRPAASTNDGLCVSSASASAARISARL